MRNINILCVFVVIVIFLSACSKLPVKHGDSADQQRQHAEQSQDELSDSVEH